MWIMYIYVYIYIFIYICYSMFCGFIPSLLMGSPMMET